MGSLSVPFTKTRSSLCLLLLLMLWGCDGKSKQATLEFFFTGVPPLEEQGGETEQANTILEQSDSEHKAAESQILSAHSYFTQRKCSKCHRDSMSIVSSSKTRNEESGSTFLDPTLTMDLGMCIECHLNPFATEKPHEL